MSSQPIIALVYSDSDTASRAIRTIALDLMEAGWRLAGLVQMNLARPGRSRCDMLLEDLGGGKRFAISEDRGPEARGCTLDVEQLLVAMEAVRGQLALKPDLVILNKFGKTESEGGGFRSLIADAVGHGVPVLIPVPSQNIETWRLFAGELSRELPIDAIDRCADGPAHPIMSHLRPGGAEGRVAGTPLPTNPFSPGGRS